MIDTHCHIHDDDYQLDSMEVLERAAQAGVSKLICVGTDELFSEQATAFAGSHDNVFATVGLHPHDAQAFSGPEVLMQLAQKDKVVAIGECGLDYYYDNSPRDMQKKVLVAQFEIAKTLNLPMVFHVRGSKASPEDAFADFWELYDQYQPRGVVHSFSASQVILDQIIRRKLYVGLNGIVTFIKDPEQLAVIRGIPIESIVLETDAPLLTPVPFRGTINEPKHICVIAEFLSELRGESTKQVADATTSNARVLFGI